MNPRLRLVRSPSSGPRAATPPGRDLLARLDYRKLFDLAPEGFVVVDESGLIVRANRAAAGLLGVSARRLLGRPFALFLPEAQRRPLTERIRSQLSAGPKRDEWKARVEPPGGTAFEAGLALAAIPGSGQGAARLVLALRDITRRRSRHRRVLAECERLREALARRLRAKEEEARRIAHLLHDEAAQFTAAIQMALEGIGRDLPLQLRRRLARPRELLEGLDERLRQLAHELRPTILDDLGVAAALGFLARSFTSRTGIPVEVRGGVGKRRLPPLVETAVYRIVQEALANVARHARARRAVVRFSRRRDLLRCSICDDGVGFDPRFGARRGEIGLGLLGIRERLETLAGRLVVRSAAGRGTELRVAIPVGRSASKAGSCSPTITC